MTLPSDCPFDIFKRFVIQSGQSFLVRSFNLL